MISASSVSDIFWTSALVKSWAPIFFPIAEPVPSAPWQAAHFDLKSVDESCAPADSGTLRATAKADASAKVFRLIPFIFQLHSSSLAKHRHEHTSTLLQYCTVCIEKGCDVHHKRMLIRQSQ